MVAFDYKKTPITQIVDYIIMYGAKSGASDIHFDPRDNGLMVRIRIDGDLQDYTLIPEEYERNLTTRIKLLANMNITESRLPQDGAIKGKFGNLDLDMRVSSLPTNEGEKIVIRILDYSRSLEGIESLGFSEKNFEKLKRMIQVPNGIILVTGATGTGKSTTTYSILQELNKPETNIITVEDPIEMNMEGLNQVQVNSEIGLTFATVLRSILRQDPNVILIGEIRDSETAQIAVRASITGHLVLSTIHTNNSLSTIERLMDMDVERYLLSTALTGIISQRLAKILCPKCCIKRETTPYEKKVFKIALNKDIDYIYDANKDGCSNCHGGYKGRIAIQEVLELDDNIRMSLNNELLTKEELRTEIYTSNVTTLLEDGLNKVLDKKTTFDEIYRIIDIDSAIIEEHDIKTSEFKNDDTTVENEETSSESNKDEQPTITEDTNVSENEKNEEKNNSNQDLTTDDNNEDQANNTIESSNENDQNKASTTPSMPSITKQNIIPPSIPNIPAYSDINLKNNTPQISIPMVDNRINNFVNTDNATTDMNSTVDNNINNNTNNETYTDNSIPTDNNIDNNTNNETYTDSSIPTDNNIDNNTSNETYTDSSIPTDTNVDNNTSNETYTDNSIPADTNVDNNTSNETYTDSSISADTNVDNNTSNETYTDNSIPTINNNVDNNTSDETYTDSSIPTDNNNVDNNTSNETYTDNSNPTDYTNVDNNTSNEPTLIENTKVIEGTTNSNVSSNTESVLLNEPSIINSTSIDNTNPTITNTANNTPTIISSSITSIANNINQVNEEPKLIPNQN